MHRFDSEARLDLLDLHIEQVKQMPGVAAGAGGADGEALLLPIDPFANQHQRARRKPFALEQGRQVGDEVGQHLLDRFRRGDRLEKAQRRARRFLGDDWVERLAGPAERLVEPEQQGLAEAAGERATGDPDQLADGLDPEAAGGVLRNLVEPQRRGRKAAMASSSPPLGQRLMRLFAEAGERVGRAGGPGNPDPRAEPEPRAEAQDALAHPLLAAEQMGDSSEVEPQAIRSGESPPEESSAAPRTGRGGSGRPHRPPARQSGCRAREPARAPG